MRINEAMLVSKEQVIRKSGCYCLVGGMIRCNPHWEAFPTPLSLAIDRRPGPLYAALVLWCCSSLTCLSAPQYHCSCRLGVTFCSSLCPQHLAQGLANNSSTTVRLLVGWMNKRMALFDLFCNNRECKSC